MRPNSQLFLFSDSFNNSIDSWFSGNVIILQDIDKLDLTKSNDTSHVVTFVKFVKDLQYTKLTTVLNYNEQGLTLAQLSGHFGYMCRLQNKDDCRYLKHIRSSATDLIQSQHNLYAYGSKLAGAYNNLRVIKGATIKEYDSVTRQSISCLYDNNDKFLQHIIDTFDRLYKCSF